MKRKILRFIISVFAVMMTIIVITPVIMTIVMSFRNGWETYVDLAIWEPAYTHAMSNSIIISFAASAGSVVIAIPAAFAFAKRGFKGSGALFRTICDCYDYAVSDNASAAVYRLEAAYDL